MNTLDKKYQDLLKEILDAGSVKSDRTGTGTISIFGTHLKHDMQEGFPLLTTKKVFWKGIVHELLWFLKGDSNIKYLVDNGVNIWVGDCLKKFNQIQRKRCEEQEKNGLHNVRGCELFESEFIEKIKTDKEFADKWGDLGPVYGVQWKNWNGIDQIAELIYKLKTNPDDRRMIVSAWNVSEIDKMTLPPCHYSFQVYTRELLIQERRDIYFKLHPDWTMIGTHEFFDGHNIPKRAISLSWNQRSVDTFLGLGFNIASYGLLLSMLGKVVNMMSDQLIFNGGDTHLYLNHIQQAKEQITRTSFELPTITFKKDHYDSLYDFTYDDIILNNYQSHETIKASLSN